MNNKYFIFYCDDNPDWISKFKNNHSKEFEIKTITNGTDFEPTLKDLIAQRKEPDIILIDLFHPKHNDLVKQKRMESEGLAAITRVTKAIEDARVPIYAAWEAYGLYMLKQARRLCPDTPIAIYTQQGLSIVKDDELIIVSESKGEWLLKGRDRFYETKRLRNMLATRNSKHYAMVTKLTLWAFSAIVFIASFIYSWTANKRADYILSFGASLSIALMPSIISVIERRTNKDRAL
jgi:hypothetical protein